MPRLLSALLVLAVCSLARADGDTAPEVADLPVAPPPGVGVFRFDAPHGQTLRVFSYRPENLGPDTPVLLVFHGVLRNADEYRDQWLAPARERGVLLLCPEMSQKVFPGGRAYNQGNVIDAEGRPTPPETWSFAVPEALFDRVRAELGLNATSYRIYGHSAGSQFVHRFLLHMPGARVSRAVAANAGTYTFPDPAVDYPFGLRGAPLPAGALAAFLARPMVVLLGDADTDRNDPNLTRGGAADAQGWVRLERGRNFFAAGRAAAEAAGVSFGWTIQEVPGVPHENALMAPIAMQALFADR